MTREELFNISEELDDTFLLAYEFDDAIEGYLSIKGQEHLVCYNYDKCINILINNVKLDPCEAIEYMEFNVINSFVGKKTPVFLYTK